MSLGQLLSKVALALPQSCPADYLDLCQLVLDHAASRRLLQEGCLLPLYVSSVCLSLSLQAPVLISGNSSFLWLSPGPLSCVLSERETFDFLQVLHSG